MWKTVGLCTLNQLVVHKRYMFNVITTKKPYS